jgi:SAM-dependent methyltransferase
LHFEAELEAAVEAFAESLPRGARLLDAGAGEVRFKPLFGRQRYVGVDLGVGDEGWDYKALDAVADLARLPFADGSFEGAINIVTLEHVPEPGLVLGEIARVLVAGAPFLIVVPHEWEEHQQPHDFFRYTRYGLKHLLAKAGFEVVELRPVGGFFRLLARRLLNAAQFFPGPLALVALFVAAPLALVLPALDSLDRRQHFTLGFICLARKVGC